MKKKYIVIISMAVIAVAAFIYFKADKKETPISFATAKAVYGPITKSVTATGTIEPLDTVSVGAQVSGVVKKVYVDYNSVVKKGQLLAQVDASILKSQDEESKANLISTRSNLEFQKTNYGRQTKLYNLGAISKADYENALNQYNSAKAAVENAGAQVNVANKTLSYTNIYSPVDGVVLNRNVSEGQTIASSFNAPVLFVIAKDLTKMQVNTAVDEADIGGVKTGQHVSFTVDAFPNDIFKGTVQNIRLEPSVSANVVTYTTLINIDNNDMKLKPGMTASINIYIEEDSNALLIPARALGFKPDSSILKKYIVKRPGKKVFDYPYNAPTSVSSRDSLHKSSRHPSFIWTKKGDTLIEKRIITGLADDINVKVMEGLAPGETVITNIVLTGSGNKRDKSQRSPFMPQTTPQRPSGSPRN